MKHICVYYEDGWPDLTCVCGEHAALIVDDDGEAFVVPLDVAVRAGRTPLPLSA